MACRDGNEKQRKFGSIGTSYKRTSESLHFSGNKKMENMNFTKKHKICIIYAATERSLKACFMCVQSMKMASEKEKHIRTIFLLHYPRDKRQLLRNLAACRSIIPSANLQNHRVYLFNIIYANFFSFRTPHPPPCPLRKTNALWCCVTHGNNVAFMIQSGAGEFGNLEGGDERQNKM